MSISTNIALLGFDELKKMATSMPGWNQRAANSALATIGFNLKKEGKSAVSNNSFGWPKVGILTQLSRKYPSTINKANQTPSLEIAREAVVGTITKKPWGSLANFLVYSVEKEQGILFFGFASGTYGTKKGYTTSAGKAVRVPNVIGDKLIDLCKALTEGFTYAVGAGPRGDNQRRYFAALGIILKPRTIMKIPARPLVGPTFVMSKPAIPGWFRDKFWERLNLYANSSPGIAA